MKLKSFNYFVGLLIIFLYSPLLSEEKIDIWKNKKEITTDSPKQEEKNDQGKPDLLSSQTIQTIEKIQIEEGSQIQSEEQVVYGIYEPANFDFNLNMWSATKAEDLRSSLKRLNKINLSKSSNEILEAILLSFSYPPQGMDEKEFIDLKINWLIENDRIDLLESFLKQNEKFDSKSKAVQYLVDKNIASGNIKEGCEQIKFIDASIKDSYLEKFKIYCLIFNDKKPEAQLLLDLLREQKQSSKFYDDKINFLIGVTNKTNNKINEKNLLNFYLSSITIADFKYEPTKKTKPEIWKYLNAANLIKLEDASDKEKLKEFSPSISKSIPLTRIFDREIMKVEKMKKQYTQSFYAKIYLALNALEKKISRKMEAKRQSFDTDEDQKLNSLLAVFRFRTPIIRQWRNTLGVLEDSVEVFPGQDPRKFVSLEDIQDRTVYLVENLSPLLHQNLRQFLIVSVDTPFPEDQILDLEKK